MNRESKLWRFLVPAVCCAALTSISAEPIDTAANAVRLRGLLDRMSRTAMLFRDTALQFACRERIHWRDGEEHFEYVFVYDEAKGFQDYRTEVFLGKRRKAPKEVSLDDYGVPLYLRSAYLWVFVFRRSRQPLHHYRIVGEEEVLGIPAVMIEFEPIPPIQRKLNDWYGTAWVDPKLGQLLKVVAYEPEDFRAKSQWEAHQAGTVVDEVRAEFGAVTTWFTEERNGLRFPGKVILERSRYRWEKGWGPAGRGKKKRLKSGEIVEEARKPGKMKLLRVEQTYRKYQFFSVRTAEEIEDFILGAGAREDD